MWEQRFCSVCKAVTGYQLRIYFLAFICRALLFAEVFARRKIFVKGKNGWTRNKDDVLWTNNIKKKNNKVEQTLLIDQKMLSLLVL